MAHLWQIGKKHDEVSLLIDPAIQVAFFLERDRFQSVEGSFSQRVARFEKSDEGDENDGENRNGKEGADEASHETSLWSQRFRKIRKEVAESHRRVKDRQRATGSSRLREIWR